MRNILIILDDFKSMGANRFQLFCEFFKLWFDRSYYDEWVWQLIDRPMFENMIESKEDEPLLLDPVDEKFQEEQIIL